MNFSKINNIYLFFCLVILVMLYTYLLKEYVVTSKALVDTFEHKVSTRQIDKILEYTSMYSWLDYVINLLKALIRYTAVGFTLYIGTTLSNYKVNFFNIYRVVLLSEFIMLLPIFINIIHFTFIQTEYTLEDIQYFAPLSLLSLFDPTSIDPIWIYPLQTVNVFEIAYWFALAYGIWRLTRTRFEESFFLVVKSYLPALVVWIAFVMFLTVTLSPA